MKNNLYNGLDLTIGFSLGLLALGVYLATLSVGAYPGDSASYIVQVSGLFPRLSPLNPFWSAISYLIVQIPFGSMALKLNVFSALCGAASVLLMYLVVCGTIRNIIDIHVVDSKRAVIASRLAGSTSALFLAFCIPFWIVSNRAHMASFDVFIMTGMAWLFLKYVNNGSQRLILLFALLYGLSVVEFATMIVLFPLFGGYLLFNLWKREQLEIGFILRIVVSGLAGLLFYFIAAWFFAGSEGCQMREYGNYFQVIWYMWTEQYMLIAKSLPKTGWLLVLIMTSLPWLTCLFISTRALNAEKEWTYYLLHIVMTGLIISVLLNAPFAPWSMFKMSHLLVTPYVLIASVFGYLVAYWYLLPSFLWLDSESPVLVRLGEKLGPYLAFPFFVLVVVTPFSNYKICDGRWAGAVNTYARTVLKCLAPEHQCLVTDGVIDNHLLIAADDCGRKINILNIRNGDNEPYMSYIAAKFDSPRLKNLARTGMFPMLQEWIETDVEIKNKLAIEWPCDLWVGAGYSVVPYGLVTIGEQDIHNLVPDVLLAKNRELQNNVIQVLQNCTNDVSLSRMARHLLRGISLNVVNLGCLMEDLGRKDDAFRLYAEARNICPENISALLNQSSMVAAGYKTDKRDSIKNDMNALNSGDIRRRPDIWTLSRSYGYVRTPAAFAQLGLVWAFSGQPGAAVTGLKKAMELLPEKSKGLAKQMLADVYLVQDHDEDSESLYYELLIENASNKRALMGMARVSARKHDLKKALDYLKKAENAGVPKSVITMEMALFNVMFGNIAQARIGLEEVVDLKPEGVMGANIGRAWIMLMGIYLQQRDLPALSECVKRIEENKTLNKGLAFIAKGHVGLAQNNLMEARNNFCTALDAIPNNILIIELLLRLDVVEGKKKESEGHVQQLLKLDPNNALGNYIRGAVQFDNMEYALAEDSYRKSLQRRRSPEVLNDLAWVLQRRDACHEAERLIRESISLNDKNYISWDTFGVVLMKLNKLDEAEKALDRSMSLAGREVMSVIIHMAQVNILKGSKQKAMDLISMISAKQSSMSAENSKDYEKIQRALIDM
ncbi:MAG: hypothetical protein A2283_23595 [Lentisphaerae bacterium RIFOXYA12_FULL_48_11]|nr:MAG: hypothetical protein A2283_23595 [Lentisphaerae bacterium RIFOXYA12_FULL_48_11]